MSATEVARRDGRPGAEGVPRGLGRTGPVIFSYGFRPFFLAGAIWAVVAMLLWIAALSGQIDLASDYGAPNWHAHEMLFGFGSAILAGFLLTAVPNWTGRLPVSGVPLALLFAVWCLGRFALLVPDMIGVVPAVVLDSLFLPILLAICGREVIAGRKWKDLKVLAGLLALSFANILFHVVVIDGEHSQMATRMGVSAYTVLVMIVGGRILPSFTRNWLNKTGRTDFPVPYNGFDIAAILIGVSALAAWTVLSDSPFTVGLAILAGVAHAIRLYRWRGWTTAAEPIVAILHIAYFFVPLGFIAIALGTAGWMEERAVLHILTVGVIGCMMLAVMTRASLGHTGRKIEASKLTSVAYGSLVLCTLVRPAAEMFPDIMMHLYACAGLLWCLAFGLFCFEYAPYLTRNRKPLRT